MPRYQSFTLPTLHKIPQIDHLTDDDLHVIRVVGSVLPFRTNIFVLNHLINWDNIREDPMFILTFPQRDMLKANDFERLSNAMLHGASKQELETIIHEIRLSLNPHPAGQIEYNVPLLNDGTRMDGIQHKYQETLLFFPKEGQTCHAYCTWCFRWPQFVNMDNLKFASNDAENLVQYLRENPSVTDVLITGGDPMIMRTKRLRVYIEAILNANLETVRNIRIGTKALTYWPYRFTSDTDADELMELFERVVNEGKHLAIMAHVNHPNELEPEAVVAAIQRIRNTGAVLRTQGPLLRHVNDQSDIWARMWEQQVKLGMIPYYFFVARDTGAQDFFAIPLVDAADIFRSAYNQVSGLSRTVRGPSLSTTPGKVQILGTTDIGSDAAFVLQYIQARNPDWVNRPFFAKYDPDAIWFDELRPFSNSDIPYFPHFGTVQDIPSSTNRTKYLDSQSAVSRIQ